MGLDMGLYARRKGVEKVLPKKYTDLENWDWINFADLRKDIGDEKIVDLIKNQTLFVIDDIEYGSNVYFTIMKSIGYWRKANAIHRWFVENVQCGEDDCGTYKVDKDLLEELRHTCLKVLDSLNDNEMETRYTEDGDAYKVYIDTEVAEELLPTQEGFFFGATIYDNYYKEDLLNTVQILNKCLFIDNNKFDFYYQASW